MENNYNIIFYSEPIDELVGTISPYLPIFVLTVTLFSLFLLIKQIKNSDMKIEDSITLIVWNILLMIFLIIIISGWGKVWINQISEEFGVTSSILLLTVFIAIASYLKIISLTIKVSKTNQKLQDTIHELSYLKYEIEKNSKKKNK